MSALLKTLLLLTALPPAANAPLAPEQTAKTAIVPAGFSVTAFASEPDVKQPIAFAIDDRGRLFVAEAYNYPVRTGQPNDRILILEDSDGDGVMDKRTVFFEGLKYVTGVEVGFGGVWVMSPPELLFIPDANGDDKPDSKPRVLLDGFGVKPSAHNIANGFCWGPDGWLYAGHGRTSPSDVGKPGTPPEKRIHFDGGVYRYHPTRHVFEGFADGTTNPWGVDFDDYGQAFVSNCVTPHLYHMIQGGHYEPARGRKSSQYAYQRIPTIADHLHYTGKKVRDNLGDDNELAAGGGHAHSGTLVYLGDSWPESYRNTVLMCNIHGKRINNDKLIRKGSGYIATHGQDLLTVKDPWFVGVTLRTGPDGSVFVTDWSDTGECHSYKNTQRETGRIYKISYGKPKFAKTDIQKLANEKLVDLQLHKNDWFVRHARRTLQERAHRGDDMSSVHQQLLTILIQQKATDRKLRAIWTLFVTAGLHERHLETLLSHDDQYVRSWAVRLLGEDLRVSPAAKKKLAMMAVADPSPMVRLHLASLLQRLPLEARWEIAAGLLGHGDDANDSNLPLMIWYGIEPLVKSDTTKTLSLLKSSKLPLVNRFIARRMAEK